METIYLEIREAEGGADAKLLVEDMANIYLKACSNQSYKAKYHEKRVGYISL